MCGGEGNKNNKRTARCSRPPVFPPEKRRAARLSGRRSRAVSGVAFGVTRRGRGRKEEEEEGRREAAAERRRRGS